LRDHRSTVLNGFIFSDDFSLLNYFLFYYLVIDLTLGDYLYLAHIFFLCTIHSSPAFGEFFLRVNKSTETFSFLGRLFSVEFFFILLLGHKFDTRGLFITCKYFFPFNYTFFSLVQRVLFANS